MLHTGSKGIFLVKLRSIDSFANILSNIVELEFFEKLQTDPPVLVLAPDCVSHVYVIGGPSMHTTTALNFKVTNN